jgi:NAD(P)-dependent dehydrogenase (short-subunit alcohol dehydrogenase family)
MSNSFRSVIITGASSGLGAALARAYAAPGITLGLLGRDQARLAATAAVCRPAGAEVVASSIDVRDAAGIGAWLTDFDAKTPIDLVIANAGTSAGPALGATAEGLEVATRQVQTNLLGVINLVESVVPWMCARGRGRIAIIASIAAYRGLPYSPAYCASKAGARAYGEALRALLEPAGIGITVICPGFFDSPMTERFIGPRPFLLPLARAAGRVKRGLDRGRRRISFPWPLVLGLRLADLMPPRLGDAILRRFRFQIVPG